MRLSTKGIISIAVLLASSLKTNAHPIELKGVDKAVHIGQVSFNFFFFFISFVLLFIRNKKKFNEFK